MVRPSLRPRHISRRPEDQPVHTNPTGMDFEKRKLFIPPSFIDEIVLKGGDEYVKASDLATIVNAFILEMEKLRIEMIQVKLHLASMSDENISEEDAS